MDAVVVSATSADLLSEAIESMRDNFLLPLLLPSLDALGRESSPGLPEFFLPSFRVFFALSKLKSVLNSRFGTREVHSFVKFCSDSS